MATDSRTYTVVGILLKATERAVLVEVMHIDTTEINPPKKEWFPKTQVVDMIVADPDARLAAELVGEAPELDEFTVKHWILSEKGLLPK